MKNKKETNEEILQNFLLNIDCLNELNPWIDSFNIFDVLKISKTEIRHSNMIAWLFNPHENHGLNDSFIKNLVSRIVKNKNYGNANPLELMVEDFSSVQINREWENIDLLCVSNNFVIVIENKIDSGEHDNQLEIYRKKIETRYKKLSKIFLYLTPDGLLPSDEENWNVLSYWDILISIENAFDLHKNDLLSGQKTLIQDYINILRSKIVEDKALVDICKKIYLQYKPALDLIFENRGNLVAESIIEAFKELNIELDNTRTTNRWFVFYSKEMDKILPCLENAKGSWNDNHTYNYWISVEDNTLTGCFELGGTNLTESLKEIQKKIYMSASGKVRKNEDYVFKHVFTTKKYEINPTDPQDVKNTVNSIIEELKENEKKVISLVLE